MYEYPVEKYATDKGTLGRGPKVQSVGARETLKVGGLPLLQAAVDAVLRGW